MNKKDIKKLAEHLENCQLNAQDTLKITDEFPDMTWDDAYAIQDTIKARKLKRGAKIVGYKAGLTSHAKMKQMGVENPVFGFLVDEVSSFGGSEIVDGCSSLLGTDGSGSKIHKINYYHL